MIEYESSSASVGGGIDVDRGSTPKYVESSASTEQKEKTPANGNLWIRKWEVIIADAKDEEAWNISDLRITFEIHRERETQNFATVNIYNLTAEMENKIIKDGDRLILKAGYSGVLTKKTDENDNASLQEEEPQQYGVIFDGKILWPARNREGNVDYVLTLLCVDGKNQLDLAWVSFTNERGLNQRQIVERVCDTSGIMVSHVSENLEERRLPRGKVFFGTPRQYISDVVRGNAATFYMNGDNITLDKFTDAVPEEALVTSPETGLVGMPAQTQDGCSFTLLLNPNVHLGSLVQLKNSEMKESTALPEKGKHRSPIDDDWIYQVFRLTHRGDTRGNEWYTECEGVSRYGRGVLLAMMGNSMQNPTGM